MPDRSNLSQVDDTHAENRLIFTNGNGIAKLFGLGCMKVIFFFQAAIDWA
jgi:hypothetical protein